MFLVTGQANLLSHIALISYTDVTWDTPTYNCPCVKTGFLGSNPAYLTDCPCDVFIVQNWLSLEIVIGRIQMELESLMHQQNSFLIYATFDYFEVLWVGMLKFSPEPWFEPNFLRTGPKVQSKVQIFSELNQKFSSRFSQLGEVWTKFEPVLWDGNFYALLAEFLPLSTWGVMEKSLQVFWHSNLSHQTQITDTEVCSSTKCRLSH